MKALDVIERISNKSIINLDLKYCLVDENKHPFRIDSVPARPNMKEDFVSFEELIESPYIKDYAGIGISIQASEICAIDIDKCFKIANDVNSGDERAKYFLNLFKNAYCEFSFSGTGLRIIFKAPLIDDYSTKYYIKNEKYKIEYYQPGKSFRYVTLTGNSIYDNDINLNFEFTEKVYEFLNKYMERPIIKRKKFEEDFIETRSYEELMKIVKKHYFKNMIFQNLWFNPAPGSGKDESERDYHLVSYLYENITQDEQMIKKIFESSNFFKTKDSHHVYKWNYNDFRYYKYLYNNIKGEK